MTTLALDGRVDFASLDGAGWPVFHRLSSGRAYTLDSGRRVHVFAFGAVVLEGAAEADEDTVGRLEKLTGRVRLDDTVETYQIEADASLTAPVIGWNRMVIPEHTTELMHAIALLLGQSAALERYERAADRLIDATLAIASQLAESGRPPGDPGELVRAAGRITRDRLEVARLFFLVDRPEVTWEKPEVAQLYDQVFRNLELDERHRGVLHKLETVESCMRDTVGLWHERRSHFLEWAIVLLIVLEIVFALVGLYG